MKRVVIKARAKINWGLDVIRKRRDGYHDLETIMQSINIWDQITLIERKQGISLTCNLSGVPLDSTNLVWKAAELIRDRWGIDKGLEINLHKNIPVSAGLAGGSADAAAVLVGLNSLWNLKIGRDQIKYLGSALGADIPFCVDGGTALAKGIGEQLTPIKLSGEIWMVIVKPPFGVSTGEVFSKLDIKSIETRPNIDGLIQSLSQGDIKGVGKAVGNVLEGVTTSLHPEVLGIKRELLCQGAMGSLMSGSGPSVYGIFRDRPEAERAARFFQGKYAEVFVTHTSDKGIELMEES